MWQKSFALAACLACQLSYAAPCETADYQAFDFWLGEWQVRTPDGQPAGTNSITREEGLCLLVERWRSAQGGTGQSYNYYDPQGDKWRQVWVSQGAIIDISGGLTETGAMRLEGDIVYQADGPGIAAAFHPHRMRSNRLCRPRRAVDGNLSSRWLHRLVAEEEHDYLRRFTFGDGSCTENDAVYVV